MGQVSNCCKAPIEVVGCPDFIGDKVEEMIVCTAYYKCTKCDKPCNAVANRKKRKVKKRMK